MEAANLAFVFATVTRRASQFGEAPILSTVLSAKLRPVKTASIRMSTSRKRKILIIEGDSSVRNALLNVLDSSGCDTDVASDSKQAIELLRDEKFDAVLLDLRYTDVQASELVPSIHSLRPSLLANVLVLTGEVEDSKTVDLIEQYLLLRVPGNRSVLEIAATLRAILRLPPLLDNT